MQRVKTLRPTILVVAALLIAAASFSTSATFQADPPGSGLEPVGDAGSMIQLIEGRQHLLWTTLTGTVTSHTTIGWPVIDGGTELGGALAMERPSNGNAGVIELSEEPMTLSFELDR